ELAASKARWRVVYFHHAPYSSGPHGSTLAMRWPFKAWGADLVLSGHDHIYERVVVDGLTYLVDGLGGAPFYTLGTPIEGSVVRFSEAAGALFVEADAAALRARFETIDGRRVDEVVVPAAVREVPGDVAPPAPTPSPTWKTCPAGRTFA